MSIGFDDFQNPAQLVLIAGPCVIESEEHVNRMADAIAAGDAAGCFYFVRDDVARTQVVDHARAAVFGLSEEIAGQ